MVLIINDFNKWLVSSALGSSLVGVELDGDGYATFVTLFSLI